MSVWYAIPSKRSAAEATPVLEKWRQQGYRVAVFRDEGDEPLKVAHINAFGQYHGYAATVNELCYVILNELDPTAEWIVTGGDDVLPDPNMKAAEIAQQCSEHFGGTFGVMQPTGDRWGEDPNLPNLHPMRTAYADRVCCSPWMGTDFCRRMYGGEGPLWREFVHQFVDEELQNVALKLGVLCQRRDITHLHNHWARTTRQMPPFLKDANTPQHWNKFKALFESRKAAGFPGHEPLPDVVADVDSEPALSV